MTALQFEQDGDVVTADGDGFITIYSVDSDGAYFVRMEFEVRLWLHVKNFNASNNQLRVISNPLIILKYSTYNPMVAEPNGRLQ